MIYLGERYIFGFLNNQINKSEKKKDDHIIVKSPEIGGHIEFTKNSQLSTTWIFCGVLVCHCGDLIELICVEVFLLQFFEVKYFFSWTSKGFLTKMCHRKRK